MDEEVVSHEIDIQEFMKPACPVKVGDRFYRKYHVPNSLVFNVVEKIEEKKDDDGTYYVITARSENVAIGVNVHQYSSRNFENIYEIKRKGTDC